VTGTGEGDRFHWPPVPAPASAPPPPSQDDEPAPPEITVRGGLLRSMELALLGGGDTSARHLFRASGWSPDAPGAWCPGCGGSVGVGEVADGRCASCRSARPPWDRMVRLGSYEGALREAIHRMKFRGDRAAGRLLGGAIGETIASLLDDEGGPHGAVTIVPAPTTTRRRLARGIDHTLVMARAAGWDRGWGIRRPIRRKHRPPQSTVALSARAGNVRGAMLARRVPGGVTPPDGGLVVVLDDVMTTGATMRAACRAVLGAWDGWAGTIWAAVAGVTPDPERRSADAVSDAGGGGEGEDGGK